MEKQGKEWSCLTLANNKCNERKEKGGEIGTEEQDGKTSETGDYKVDLVELETKSIDK